nr:unnamed protein product [Spirometra erinaceieuropaei]
MRGAEIGRAHGSDHFLIRTRLKVHLSSAPKMPPRRLDAAKIRQTSTAEDLSREIRTCFTTRAEEEDSHQWLSPKTSVYGAAEKILGYNQRRRSDWISGRTLQLSAQTARARSHNDDCFRQLLKMTAKSARNERKQYWAEIATTMEQASNVGDTRKLYQLIRQVSGKPSTLSDSVHDMNGGFIADNSAKVERWREHFEQHLNFDTQTTTPLLSSSAEFLRSPTYAVSCDTPSKGEVVNAIRKLRNNKAPREDGITAEIFKSCRHGRPGSMKRLNKRGETRREIRCENYRGITLIDVSVKIFAIVLLRRFQAVRDSRTRPNQAGFPVGRGCANQIFALRRILEFRHSYQQPTPVYFIDSAAAFDSLHHFKKALDSVLHQRLLYKLSRIRVRGKLSKWIENFLIGRSQIVSLGDQQSTEVMDTNGVPQGSVLGCILFLIYIDDCIHWLDCDIAMFADDTKLWNVIRNEHDEANLQANLNRLKRWSSHWLLPFNVAKCNIMRIDRASSTHRRKYSLHHEPLPEVEVQKDLGVCITSLLKP